MVDAGLIVLVSFISPFRAERRMAREPLPSRASSSRSSSTPRWPMAEARDLKGLYRKARAGELANFTGIDSPYEAPEHPELHLDTATESPEAAAQRLLDHLRALGIVA